MALRVSDYTRMQKRMKAGKVRVGEFTKFEKQWAAEHSKSGKAGPGFKPTTTKAPTYTRKTAPRMPRRK